MLAKIYMEKGSINKIPKAYLQKIFNDNNKLKKDQVNSSRANNSLLIN